MSENKMGRPPLWTDADTLEAAIEEYFDYCDNRIRSVYSKKRDDVIEIIDPAPYTLSGLAYFLHMDRKSLYNYSKKKQFFPTIKAARDRVEADIDSRMNDKETFTPGLIFNAKNNFDWKDRTESEQSGTIEVITRKHSGSAATQPDEDEDDDSDQDQD